MHSAAEGACSDVELAESLVSFVRDWCFVTEEAVRPSTVGSTKRGLAVNFLVDDGDGGWDTLPHDWRAYFEQMDGVDGLLLRDRSLDGTGAPHSLVAFLDAICGFERIFENDVVMPVILEPQLVRGMKEKKVREVALLAGVVDECARVCNAGTILDVGSGHGHLSRVLSLQMGHRVVGIDCSDYHAQQAREKTERLSSKPIVVVGEGGGNVRFAQACITKDTSEQDVRALLLLQEQHGGGDGGCVLMVGLHTCGDLATVMMRLLLENRGLFCGLVSVPCCYSKNFCGSGDGFNYKPMSKVVQERMDALGLHLTEGSLMAACHSLFGAKHPGVSKLSVYRCLLQKFLFEMRGVSKEQLLLVRVPTVSKANATSFAQYARVFDPSICAAEAEDYWARHGELCSRRVVAFWSLRELVGAAIEVLILHDRCCMLREEGRHVRAVRCLGEETPRNVALIVT